MLKAGEAKAYCPTDPDCLEAAFGAPASKGALADPKVFGELLRCQQRLCGIERPGAFIRVVERHGMRHLVGAMTQAQLPNVSSSLLAWVAMGVTAAWMGKTRRRWMTLRKALQQCCCCPEQRCLST